MRNNIWISCSVLELEEVTSNNQKMKQIIQQKEEKMRAMEQKWVRFKVVKTYLL
jgi:hypothetical protein